jgi:hypothetical protein
MVSDKSSLEAVLPPTGQDSARARISPQRGIRCKGQADDEAEWRRRAEPHPERVAVARRMMAGQILLISCNLLPETEWVLRYRCHKSRGW